MIPVKRSVPDQTYAYGAVPPNGVDCHVIGIFVKTGLVETEQVAEKARPVSLVAVQFPLAVPPFMPVQIQVTVEPTADAKV